jgi:hypothetical protein
VARNEVRLYRFFNYIVGEDGEPFALCDKHKEIQKIPGTCALRKIADKAVDPCINCERESAQAVDEPA